MALYQEVPAQWRRALGVPSGPSNADAREQAPGDFLINWATRPCGKSRLVHSLSGAKALGHMNLDN
ncbi:MAG: hypothetical protein ACRD18_16355 [Terriglobia bacterium]